MNFITQMGYLGWFAIGVFLILAELFVPGTYLIWFGFSAFMMGIIVSFISLTVVETLVCFALISAVFAGFG